MSTKQRTGYPKPRVVLNREWARSDLRGGESLLDRVWAKIEVRGPDECWPFTGCLASGYGRVGRGGRHGGTGPAHRVIAEAYLGVPTPEQTQVRHLCGYRACCNPGHLAWGDQAANEADKVRHGLSNRGDRHGMAKLAEEQVREIHYRLKLGESQRSVAERFGIAQQSVSEVATGKTWGWMGGGDAE